jgi:hypothetical protein
MNVQTAWPWVIQTKVFLHFANSANCAFKNPFDENTLLGVYYLIVAGLKLSVNINVLYVQTSHVLENFIIWPVFDVLITVIRRYLQAFHYLLLVFQLEHVRL